MYISAKKGETFCFKIFGDGRFTKSYNQFLLVGKFSFFPNSDLFDMYSGETENISKSRTHIEIPEKIKLYNLSVQFESLTDIFGDC